MERYLRNRAAKGFNVIQAVALAELDGLTEPNRQGHLPLIEKDPTRPEVRPGPANDYWDFMDDVIKQAGDLGLYVALLPTWGKYVTSGPFDGRVDGIFNPTNAVSYGRFVGERFRNRPNLIWILGGDKAPSSPEALAIWRGMAQGLKSGSAGGDVHDAALMTYHTSGPGHVSDYIHEEAWLDFTTAQSSHGDLVESWRFIEKHWNRQPVKPVIDLESSYPGALIPAAWLPAHLRASHPSTRPSNDDHARRAAYWAVFAGAFGHTYGHNAIWQMHTQDRKAILDGKLTWQEALDAPSAAQMGHLRRLMESRPVLTRVPDQSILANDTGAGAVHRRATSASDGSYAMVYTPTGASFKVRMNVIKGAKVQAWWFNPRDGSAKLIGEFPSTGERAFISPDKGEQVDWVLVLDDAARNYPAPGSRK